MIYDYTETEIQEALDDLVASGEVIKKGDGYFVPDHKRDLAPTDADQDRAIENLIKVFSFNPGDFVSMGFFEDGVEIRVNRA